MAEDFCMPRARGEAEKLLRRNGNTAVRNESTAAGSIASGMSTKPNANREMHPAEPAGGRREMAFADGIAGAVKIKKRQTSRRIENIPYSYPVSILAKELWAVKGLLLEYRVSLRLGD